MKQVYSASENPHYDPYVEFVQRQLNNVRDGLLHNLPYLKPDGLYGEKTKAAVREFQKACNIAADGKFGPQTRMCLAQKMRELPSMSSRGQSFSANKTSLYDIYEFVADKVIKNIADTMSDVSDLVCKQVQLFQNKKNISHNDIKHIVDSMINKPNVKVMRESIEKNVWKELLEISHGNTNIVNYKKDIRTISKIREIGEAQRQISKGLLSKQSSATVSKILQQQIVENFMKELESANFKRIITDKVSKATKIPKAGGILTALSFLPLVSHFCELIYKFYQGQEVKDTVTKIVADIISLLVGFLLTLIIASIVAAVGLTGGLAIIVVVALGIVTCILLSLFFPDWETHIADKIVNCILGIINSMEMSKTSTLYYQLSWPTQRIV